MSLTEHLRRAAAERAGFTYDTATWRRLLTAPAGTQVHR